MFKVLILADIHGQSEFARRAVETNSDVDLVAIAGDITNFGGAEDVVYVLDSIRSALDTPPPIVAVPGNCDTLAARKALDAAGVNIEGLLIQFPSCFFAGSGGALRRAGITSYERTEGQLAESLASPLARLKTMDQSKPLVILSHSPPYGTNADRHGEQHVGSESFASLLGSSAAAVWICGHIHESRCVSLEDGCLIVNPGPGSYGYYAILEIKKGPDLRWQVRAFLSK
ncbi:MAG: metallophosphoesterase [Spirochaetes bacterium]|nr:MAG: metallophosphoesterase [Spirochaetota bacterium]